MQPDFQSMMSKAGLPVTEEAAKAQWDEALKSQAITIENNSPFSPFWRTIKAIITQPVVSLFEWMAKKVMPDLFIMTASREALVQLHGPSRNVFVYAAVKAKGILTFHRENTEGVFSLDAGVVVHSYDLASQVYAMVTLQPIVLIEGQTDVAVMAEAMEPGQAFNLPGQMYEQLASPVEGLSVTNGDDWLVRPGADAEDTEDYRARIRNVFGTAARWHTNAVYQQLISEFGIPIDNIVIQNGAPRGPGSANAFIYLDVGQVSDALLQSINDHIRRDGHHGHGDDFAVYGMPTQPMNITLTYWLHPNQLDVRDELDTLIRAAFRQNDVYQPTRPRPLQTYSISLLTAQLHQAFPQVRSVSFDCTDIDCGLWLPTIDQLVVKHG
ncbi:baseplate J/gp47 family protein [Algicola sagamiensis]|uniref:baseplate J/gp47 family protein n=1 Tax=Algicola sagamiensis TaxID=163869 RepID=UPI0003804FDE|nr:baseplate J/gp47 family protein [Algicola sagamiensis]